MDLVIDIGNSRVKAALFEGDDLKESFAGQAEELKGFVQGKSIGRTLVASVNEKAAQEVAKILDAEKIPFSRLDVKSFEQQLDVIEKEKVGADRIANIYGALYHCPLTDCIVVDIGTAVTFDYISKEGRYLGGAIYPGLQISAAALHEKTADLPKIEVQRPENVLGKTTKDQIQSGVYYGLLGAIERIVAELRMKDDEPAFVSVLATGGVVKQPRMQEDLMDFVDVVDPHLTLIGLREILKERQS